MAAMSYSGVWGMGSGSSWVQGLFWSQEDIWGLGRGGGCTALWIYQRIVHPKMANLVTWFLPQWTVIVGLKLYLLLDFWKFGALQSCLWSCGGPGSPEGLSEWRPALICSCGMKGQVAQLSQTSLLDGSSAPCGGQGQNGTGKRPGPLHSHDGFLGAFQKVQVKLYQALSPRKLGKHRPTRMPSKVHWHILWKYKHRPYSSWAAGGMVSLLCWGVIETSTDRLTDSKLYVFETPLD